MLSKSDEIELTKPAQAREPDISVVSASRLRPLAARAVVSPIVSVADTRKIKTTEKIASGRNSILYGIKCGKEMMLVPAIAEKSTFP